MNITNLIKELKINKKDYEIYANKFAKLSPKENKKNSKLIVVTSLNPTPMGEGKTTLLIGLVDAMNKNGCKTIGVLREPSLGPVFGMKGTATGGGKTKLKNDDEINLHFTGDFHAITTANNLISTIIENEIYFSSNLNIDKDKILWKRCLDLNDRGLRDIEIKIKNNLSYNTGFNITAASDMMALFCLVKDKKEFKNKLEETIVAYSTKNKPIKIKDLEISEAIIKILDYAMKPNLVMTGENNPIIIHGGPFANIAHGCNSIIATRTALNYAGCAITECGFGADLGLEKFMDIKMQESGLFPSLIVVCATIKSLKYHGEYLNKNNKLVAEGFKNLQAHLKHIKNYNIKPLVILNINKADTKDEINEFIDLCEKNKIDYELSYMYSNGSKNTDKIVKHIKKMIKDNKPKFLYDVKKDDLNKKIINVATKAYGATNIEISDKVKKNLKDKSIQDYYICISKTQYSLSSDPKLLNCPKDIPIKINDIYINHACKMVVLLCGEIFRMPGLNKVPKAKKFSI